MKTFLILSILVSSLIASASIRIVRGGGLAEMQMVSIHQNLKLHLRPCIQSQNICGLDPQSFLEFQNLYQSHTDLISRLGLIFVPRFATGEFFQVSGSSIVMASQKLYTESSQPLEFKKLLAIMVALRLEIQGTNKSFQQNLNLALKIWQTMQQRHQSFRVQQAPQLLLAHVYRLEFTGWMNQSFYIEDRAKSYDVSSFVKSLLPCGELHDWNFQQWQSTVQGNKAYIMTKATSACHNLKPSLIVSLDLDPQGLVQASTIRAQLRY